MVMAANLNSEKNIQHICMLQNLRIDMTSIQATTLNIESIDQRQMMMNKDVHHVA